MQAIEQLLEKRRNHFDYILLETTGVADPLPIAKMFWLDDELHSDLILDGRTTKTEEILDRCSSVCRPDHGDRWLQWSQSKTIRKSCSSIIDLELRRRSASRESTVGQVAASFQ